MKKITRTYRNKKTGELVTKTYNYSHKSTRGKTLVGKGGRINEKNIESYKKSIQESTLYTEGEKREMIADLQALTRQRAKSKTKLTVSGFLGRREEEKIPRMFRNAGWAVEEFAEIEGLDVAEVLKDSNWDKDTLTVNGISFLFEFTYTDSFWRRVQ